jgi:hypothetical protein
MFSAHEVWLFFHILLFVFWLGADLGVLVSAHLAKSSDLSFEQRVTLLKVASIIDMAPRTAFALMLPVGLQLSVNLRQIPLETSGLALSWLFSAAWLAVTWGIVLNHGKPLAEWLEKIQLLLLTVLTLVLVGVGAWSMLGDGPVLGGWLSFKIIVFGLICGLAIVLDLAFRPVGAAFAELAEHGSTPEVEARITAGINKTIAVVLVLYVALVVAAFIGITKPF